MTDSTIVNSGVLSGKFDEYVEAQDEREEEGKVLKYLRADEAEAEF